MPILKFAINGGLVLFGAVGLFVALVFFMTVGPSGPITISYPADGRMITETITAATDPSRHVRLQILMGYGPAVLGALALFVGVRWFRT